jgi:hypothetical protein
VSLLISTFIHEDLLLLGPPTRIRDGIAWLAAVGVEWIMLGLQAVGSESLARQAERMIASAGTLR